MGKRGPPPKPTKLKLLEGTFRADRVAPDEPEPTVGIPVCPAWILANEDARLEWDRVVPELARLGMLTVIDGAELEGYCAHYARAVGAERELATKPALKKAPFGPKAARIISIAKVAWQEVRAFGKEYGLSPASRTRISAPNQQPPQDTDEDFLFGDGRSA
jgi:P27 family predicted phage terminase small subunit